MAFTQLDGRYMYGKWQKAKATTTESKKDYVNKMCKLFDCSENEAKSLIENKIYDEKRINNLYEMAYEPEKIKVAKAPKTKK